MLMLMIKFYLYLRIYSYLRRLLPNEQPTAKNKPISKNMNGFGRILKKRPYEPIRQQKPGTNSNTTYALRTSIQKNKKSKRKITRRATRRSDAWTAHSLRGARMN